MVLNRKEFIAALQSNTEEITGVRWCKEDCDALIDIFTTTVTRCLVKGEYPNIMGFGKFEVKDCCESSRPHPVTGEIMVHPAHKAPVFRPGETLKRAIKES